MPDRFLRIAVAAALVLLALFVAQPYVTSLMFSAEAPRAVTARGDLAPAEASTVALFERAAPSVVYVFAKPRQGMISFDPETGERRQGGGEQTGSGFVWDAAGHVVTNNHVIQGGGEIQVRLSTGEVVPATLAGTDPNYDLAVLKLGRVTAAPPPIAIGTSADLKVGQFTYAIGNPFGLDHTLTTGVVSALQRRLPTAEGRELSGVIQTDAAINPGNSGGPLLDSAGRLIGVNTAIFSPSGASAGIGFAIPVDVVNRVVPNLIRTGRTPSPGIGIVAASEDAAARSRHRRHRGGAGAAGLARRPGRPPGRRFVERGARRHHHGGERPPGAAPCRPDRGPRSERRRPRRRAPGRARRARDHRHGHPGRHGAGPALSGRPRSPRAGRGAILAPTRRRASIP